MSGRIVQHVQRLEPRVTDCLHLVLVFLYVVIEETQRVADNARILRAGAEHLAKIRLLGIGQPRLPGNSGIHAAADKSGTGITGGHVLDVEIIHAHVILPDDIIEIEQARTAGGVQCHFFATQIFDGVVFVLADNAVTAIGSIQRKHLCGIQSSTNSHNNSVDGLCIALNCTGSYGALDIAGALDDTQIYIDTVLFKDTLLLSDKQRRIANPCGEGDGHRIVFLAGAGVTAGGH